MELIQHATQLLYAGRDAFHEGFDQHSNQTVIISRSRRPIGGLT